MSWFVNDILVDKKRMTSLIPSNQHSLSSLIFLIAEKKHSTWAKTFFCIFVGIFIYNYEKK